MFCLGVTDVDPLRYGLLFERFLDPESDVTPFVHVDFDEKGRVRVIEHLAEKYGDGHLALVIVFGAFPSDNPHYNDRLKIVVCQKGIHSCSVILGDKDAIEYVPTDTYTDPVSGRRYLVSQYPDEHVSKTGALQLGIIGIETLSVVKGCLALIRERYGTDIRLEDIQPEDPKAFDLYRRGDTDGVFHFEAPCMKRMVSRMQPDRLEDLMMMDALYRPASAHLFFQLAELNKEGSARDSSIPEVDDILAETFGLVVYQEQVMEIAQRVAGFTPGHSDKLRKALCRNDGLLLEAFRSKFILGGLRKGFDENSLEKVWETLRPLGKILFNKSHAACYALLSFRTAWLKAHYPEEFAEACKKR
jgi:DNA polymerase-3 subunit alpha